MFEKVNPAHPDKIADRIAGALVDEAYRLSERPRIAVEVLIGHGECHIITESSVSIDPLTIKEIVSRIAGDVAVDYCEYKQDEHLSENQADGYRCGDNGIFKGMPVTQEQKDLTETARFFYAVSGEHDGKYILAEDRLIVCQSHCDNGYTTSDWEMIMNPLGYWTGGIDVDTGATNRKLGSDMGDSVTGGGLHGKDLSKADVSVNIYAWLKAQETGQEVDLYCAIGDDMVDGKPYTEIVEIAREYINGIGGFEAFAEWGLIR